jgi:hypothetical protein
MGRLSDLLRHQLTIAILVALVQLGFAAFIGWFLTERWQRWRQQREFQHRTLGKFSELSYDLHNRLSELLVARGRIKFEYRKKFDELLDRWTLFLSMRPEVIAAYGREFVLRKHYQGLITSLRALKEYVKASEPVPTDLFEPEQDRFLAHREAVVAEMVQAMGLLSKHDYQAEITQSERRLADAEVKAQKANAQSGPATMETNRQ